MKIVLLIIFCAIIQSLPGQADTMLIRARGQMMNANFEKAWQYFEKSKKTDKQLILQQIEAAWQTARYQEMRQLFGKLSYSRRHWQYLYLTRYYARNQNPDSAFLMLEKLLKQRRKPPRSQVKTDTVLQRLKYDHRWDSLWKLKHYKNYNLKVETAARELKVKNYDLALTLLDELIDDRAYRDRPWYLRSKLLYRQGVYRSALNDIDRAIDEEDDIAKYYALRSRILLKLNRKRRALRAAEQALTHDPYNPEFYGLAAKAALIRKKNETALKYAQLHHAGFPENPEALKMLAELIYKNGSCIKALPYINQAIEKQKYNPELYFLRAKIYQSCKVFAQAEKDYSMCLDFWPHKGAVYMGRAVCRHHMNNQKGCCSDLQKALDYGVLEADEKISKWCY